jgi:hypothetical protein
VCQPQLWPLLFRWTKPWLAVLGHSVRVGGTPYQMLVIVPMWSASPPESVRAFFSGTRYNETIRNFFGPQYMAARLAPLCGAYSRAGT